MARGSDSQQFGFVGQRVIHRTGSYLALFHKASHVGSYNGSFQNAAVLFRRLFICFPDIRDKTAQPYIF